ncbi:hypothetical protein EV426DRAFT_639434 [Tirmania nivea]|nr:hypothetical protein EV426DRAFT_639434 [Tirmania nivea]
MQTQAWFRIANPQSSWTKVSLVGLDDVDDLRQAMQRKMPHTLGGYDPAQLTIMVKYGDKDPKDAVPLEPEEDLKKVLEPFGRRDSSVTCTTSSTEKIWFFLFPPFGSYEGIKKTLKYHPPKDNVLLSTVGCAWEYQLVPEPEKSRNAKEFHDTLIEFAQSQQLKGRLEKAKVFHISLENAYKDFTAVIVVDGLGSPLSSPEDRKNKNSPFCCALTACADLALQGAFIIPLCTATITGSPRKYLADTNRRLVSLELPPLHPPVIKASGKPAFPTGLVKDLLVGGCGGHGRALEALYKTHQTESLENLTNYDDLVSVVIGDLKENAYDKYIRAIYRGGQYGGRGFTVEGGLRAQQQLSVCNGPGHSSGRRGPGVRAEVRAGLKQPGPAPAGNLVDWAA